MWVAASAVLLAVFGSAAARAAEPPSLPVLQEADRAILERVYADNDVVTHFPPPSGLDSLQYFFRRLVDLLGSLFGDGIKTVFRLAPVWLTALAALLLAALVLVTLRLFAWWRRRRSAREAAMSPVALETIASPTTAARWRELAERRLESGDLTGALEATWWWFASIVAAGAVDPSWTGRELLRQSRRLDLLPEIRQLDAFRYGPVVPTVDALRGYLERLRGVLV